MTGHDDHQGRDAHFMLAEIILLAACEKGVTNGEINNWVQSLLQYVNESQYEFNLYNGDSPNPSFENFDGPPVSFLRVRVNDLAWVKSPQDPLLTPDEALVIDTTVIDIVNGLNGNVPREGDRITFMSASPNWLFCGASHGFGDGGPGGLPSPVLGRAPNYKYDEHSLDDIKQGLTIQSPIPDVNVVIFDTGYSEKQLDRALIDYPDQELLHSLYISSQDPNHPDSRLKVYTAAALNIEMPPSPNASPHHYSHKYEYEMTDHGLFIAGIIHSWAPYATIHLVEVLNSYGVCSLYGLAQAVIALINGNIVAKSKQTLIVNCSLCVTFPTQPLSAPHLPLTFNTKTGAVVVNVENPSTALEALRRLFEGIQSAFPGSCVSILAAAGNDGAASKSPEARYPAAFEEVIGVGALDANGARAQYSNQADRPPTDGVMTFGGKATLSGTDFVANNQDGIPGIYIGNFPPATQPATGAITAKGWARWAGTSFATGVMSGIYAHLAAEGYDICGESGALVASIKDPDSGLRNDIGSTRGGSTDDSSNVSSA